MIKTALKFLVQDVNEFIGLKTAGDITRVQLIALVNQEGALYIPPDKVACTLINIEEERIAKSQMPYAPPLNGNATRLNPSVKLNLYIMFAANPKIEMSVNNYEEALTLISYIISFFQSKNHFDIENSPGLDPKIGKLLVELYSLPVEQQNYLWGSIGAKYMPSVLYRVRLVEIQENNALDSNQVISEIQGVHGDEILTAHKH